MAEEPGGVCVCRGQRAEVKPVGHMYSRHIETCEQIYTSQFLDKPNMG